MIKMQAEGWSDKRFYKTTQQEAASLTDVQQKIIIEN